jgi:branched-chain amino acid transport system permease protein
MQDILAVATLGSIYLLFALGMSIAWGTIGILNFAHGSIFMFAAFAAHLLVAEVQLSLPALLAIGVLVGALLSLLVQVLAYEQILKRARDHRTAEMQILIGGIGVASIPLAIAQDQTKSQPFGLGQSSFAVETWVIDAVGLRITNIDVLVIVLAVVLGSVVAGWLRRSRHGLALRAIGVDSETASMMGVNRRALALTTMTVAGALAGLAGVLFTFSVGAITPESGDTLLLKAFACIILGGVGSIRGIVFGAYFLALAETMVLTQTSGLWVDAVSFGLIFLVLLVRPAGLFGRQEVRRT